MTLYYQWDSGYMHIDLAHALTDLSAAEQARLYKRLSPWLSVDDAQHALDYIADAIVQSRTDTAARIMAGEWPVARPKSVKLLERFIASIDPRTISVCNLPDIPGYNRKEN